MKTVQYLIIFLFMTILNAQREDKLPFYQLPENAETYTAGTVAAKQVEALGFRFYHATENLTEKDLAFKPNDEVRTTGETIQHIYDLSLIIVNATLVKPNSKEKQELSYLELRQQTLLNLEKASILLRNAEDISTFKIVFGDKEIPFWNNINGPIADAIWHCGQIASYRRTSGNPINSKVSHFTGTVKD
ncbi:hypothetical protein [Aurantibacter sp.]|uniref:hypothetical protein n=1 Tax=Aurantibacter sp. TaxID=2807103 RepID=UPI0035C7B7F9